MSKRKKIIGTSGMEELLEMVLEAPDYARPSALDHLAHWSKKHPLDKADAVRLHGISRALDDKSRDFYHKGS